jgi:hypothetical protein
LGGLSALAGMFGGGGEMPGLPPAGGMAPGPRGLPPGMGGFRFKK